MEDKTFDFKEGEVLLVDKPLNWTSFDVVNKLRYNIKKLLNVKKIKVGHAGTLDPLATGLLVICTGKLTKSIEGYQAQEKVYTGTIKLGETTPSYDLESEPVFSGDFNHLSEQDLQNAVKQFVGVIDQTPPLFSAKKIDGTRAYELARKGSDKELKSVKIEIFELKLTRIALPEVDFYVKCAKGTYIRSLAHDFGKALGCGGHLTALRREKSGDLAVSDGKTVEDWVSLIEGMIEEKNTENK